MEGVILFNFLDDTSQPITPTQMHNRLFAESNSADSFYRQASYGNIYLSGNVVGWYTVPINKTCDHLAQR